MRNVLLTIMAGCAILVFSCKNSSQNMKETDPDTDAAIKAAAEDEANGIMEQEPVVSASDTLDVMNLYASSDNLLVKPQGVLPNPSDGISGETLEHDVVKAWPLMEDGKWIVGLVYNRLWDGEDGIGLYQNLMFWTYDSNDEHILIPVDTDERFLPSYTPQRGYVVFHPDNDNLDFKDGADPDLYWKWNGYWFESSSPQE